MNMKKILTAILIFVTVILSIMFLLPLLFMLFTSFKGVGEAMSSTGLLPKVWTFENYINLFLQVTTAPILRWIINTSIVSSIGTVLVVTADVLAAYALARLNLPFKKAILVIIVWVMSIPGVITLFPSFYLIKSLGLINSFVPLILPYSANVMGVYLLYNFLLSFPRDLEESAYIEGASPLKILQTIILPSIKPTVLTLAFLTFLTIYNDYLWPNLVVTQNEMKTLTTGIASLVLGSNFVNPGMMMATTLVATLPALILFIFLNKYIVQGINNSGIK